MKELNPKISIILPTFNGEKYLNEAIESILNQSFIDFELIVVDDCSTDKTSNLLLEWLSKDKRIKIIKNNKNQGLPATLNIGFKNATGEYLTWTSDDNMFKRSALEYMAVFLETNKDFDMVSCEMDVVNSTGTKIQDYIPKHWRKSAGYLALACNIGACFLYKKSVIHKIGLYNTDAFCAEDYDYWCRMALLGKIYYSKENLYIYRLHENTLSSTRQNTIIERSTEIKEKYAGLLLKKYSMSRNLKASVYYDLWKKTGKPLYAIQSTLSNPLISPVRILLNLLKNRRNKYEKNS